jgi:hypothetical protein
MVVGVLHVLVAQTTVQQLDYLSFLSVPWDADCIFA